LLVDDDLGSSEALATLLRDEGYEVATAENGASALELLASFSPDLVISDLTMPNLGGFGLAQCIRSGNQTPAIPIILISSREDLSSRVHGFEFGADDFLHKPLEFEELSARVARLLSRARRHCEMAKQSVSDELTGMLNRRGIRNFFARAREDCAARGVPISVLLIDLTKFKAINDRYGHMAGDLALSAVSRTQQDSVRASDRVGRIGGDEFLLVLPGADRDACAQLVQRLRASQPIKLALTDKDQVAVTFAIGSATAHDGETIEALTGRADRAMYVGKRSMAPQALNS
jgi:diguanylate cyclase (GGDEF)-like protein